MEIKKDSRHRGSVSRLICLLLAVVLAAGLIISLGPGRKALAVDFKQPCSLTVKSGGEELSEDLKKADIIVDIYEVARAVDADNGQDTYRYEFLDGYKELEESMSQELNQEVWKRMAQTAAGYALEKGVPAAAGRISENELFKDLECGLYLIIARGAGIDNYKTTVKGQDGSENIATVAHSASYEYIFLPELISLPSKQDENGNHTTAGNGEWEYDIDVTLKPGRNPRAGSLEIVKNLATYNVNDPAVFVFQIEAEKGGKNVYSDVVTMIFTEAGQKKVVLDKIPAGATVKVTEIYSGASYEVTSAAEQTVTVSATAVVSVEFDNDHSTTNHGGGGVNNHFTYDSEDGWQLEQQPANRTVGE